MDWFERITGFKESSYDETRERLSIVGGRLHSSGTSRDWGVGVLEIPSLAELRLRTAGLRTAGRQSGQGVTRLSIVQGDVRQMHVNPANTGALFQVASQFNLLEMVSSFVTPEQGVTRYQWDGTQGPACAMAAGAGTIFRNYFAPVDGQPGQREDRQIDCLREIGVALGNAQGQLWRMRNGYCLTHEVGLAAVDKQLSAMDAAHLDELRGRLRVGAHWDVEVTDEGAGHCVSQVYCSALPVSYNSIRNMESWERFASLVLEAAYEATLLVALLNKRDYGSPVAYLTLLGGGAFGNRWSWISAALKRAVLCVRDAGLDIRIVSYSTPGQDLQDLADELAQEMG